MLYPLPPVTGVRCCCVAQVYEVDVRRHFNPPLNVIIAEFLQKNETQSFNPSGVKTKLAIPVLGVLPSAGERSKPLPLRYGMAFPETRTFREPVITESFLLSAFLCQRILLCLANLGLPLPLKPGGWTELEFYGFVHSRNNLLNTLLDMFFLLYGNFLFCQR